MKRELVVKYRPRRLKDIIGCTSTVKTIESWFKKDRVPQSLLFTGPSGCGKTTLARIIRRRLKCHRMDYTETNAAISRGIDMVREIQARINLGGFGGDKRVWCIDEAHQLTKDAQDALLKVLEDVPEQTHIILCTTTPTKLIRTIHTRCTELKVPGLNDKEITELICRVWKKEGGEKLSEEVTDRIAEVVEGSARKALKVLQQIMDLDGEEEMLEAIQASDVRNAAFDLVKAIMPFDGRPSWPNVKKILDGLKEDEPEGIRRLILSVCGTNMLKGGQAGMRAAKVYQSFRDNFFDTGRVGLIAACFEVVFSD